MSNDELHAFVRDFLVALKRVAQRSSPRGILAGVREVCDTFEERGRGRSAMIAVPLQFWLNFAQTFLDRYMSARGDADLLPEVRAALRRQIQDLARTHHINPEDLNT